MGDGLLGGGSDEGGALLGGGSEEGGALLGGGLLGFDGGAESQVVIVVMPCGPLVVVMISRRVVVGAVVVVTAVLGVGLPSAGVGLVVALVSEVPTVWPV